MASLSFASSDYMASVFASDNYPSLDAAIFEPGLAILPPQNARWYGMRFNQEHAGSGSSRIAGDLDSVRFLLIMLKFLPLDAEILEGNATVVVNNTIMKRYSIPRQKNFAPQDPKYGQDVFKVFAVLGTNEPPKKPRP